MRNTLRSLAALLQLTIVGAQYGSSPDSSSSTQAAAATPSSSAPGDVRTIQVGQTGFTFVPDSITADKGDVIEFVIHTSHSVARSSFDSPCQPISGPGIWSGFSSDGTSFSVTINDTNPIWLYCAAPQHCQSGMAMVINPPSGGNTLSSYKAAASGVGSSNAPSSIQGGVFGKAAGASSSSGSATSSASAAATSSSSGGAGGLTTDLFLIAAFAVGAVVLML